MLVSPYVFSPSPSSYPSWSNRPTGQVLWEELLVLSRFEPASGILFPWSLAIPSLCSSSSPALYPLLATLVLIFSFHRLLLPNTLISWNYLCPHHQPPCSLHQPGILVNNNPCSHICFSCPPDLFTATLVNIFVHTITMFFLLSFSTSLTSFLSYLLKWSLSDLQKEHQKLVFNTDYRLMQVKSIAECSKGSILQYFRPSSTYQLSLRPLFCLFLISSPPSLTELNLLSTFLITPPLCFLGFSSPPA